MVLDDPEAWGGDKPIIQYTGKWLNEVHPDIVNEKDLLVDNEPLHAGRYTASITKTDENATDVATATVTYIIEKAEQKAPEKPQYDVPINGTEVIIDKIKANEIKDSKDVVHKADAEYCLTYYSGNELLSTEWTKAVNGNDKIAITMETAWTSYNVEARYEELTDYKPSNPTRADAVYHYAGDVTVKIICDEGIDAHLNPTTNENKEFNGATLILDIRKGYYLVGGNYDVKTKLEMKDGSSVVSYPLVTQVENKKNEYSITNVPTRSNLTIIIGKTKKEPIVKAQVTPGQRFSAFAGIETTISRDSAFTAAFQISNFDPDTYDVPKLIFDSEIPENTTIILLNRVDGSYWHYRATGTVTSLLLTDFTEMGGNEKHVIPQPAATGDYVDLSYQFIVDFSQSTGGYSKDSLKMTLEAQVKEFTTQAPLINPDVTVTMKNSSFTFEKASDNGLTNNFKCTFTKGASASKWEKRASALVLKPKDDTDLPPDARIKAEVDGGTTYLYKNKESFIVPLSLLEVGEKEVNLTLQSALFPEKGGSYSFSAEWRISPSRAGKAPMTGDQAGSILNDVIFTSAARMVPSLKATGQDRILTPQNNLNLNIEMKNMDGYTISAALQRKADDGTYSGTGWNAQNVSNSNSSLKVPLGGQNPGSFRLMLTVKETDGVTIVMEVPYYFIIKEAS